VGKGTLIQWADDTINPMMGCDGCELFNPKQSQTDPDYQPECYAFHVVEQRKGLKGWPSAFNSPVLFPGRIEQACRWKDLTGTTREAKPWLNNMPRVIFLDDLGDTFTESLTIDWIAPYIPMMADSPHIWLMLTKRPGRMAKFWESYGPVPNNIWPGTSVTGVDNQKRINSLQKINSPHLWLSLEPLNHRIRLLNIEYSRLSWAIFGGESGKDAAPFNLVMLRAYLRAFKSNGVACFVKQLGSNPIIHSETSVSKSGPGFSLRIESFEIDTTIVLKDKKGGDWTEWPKDLQVREFPAPAQEEKSNA